MKEPNADVLFREIDEAAWVTDIGTAWMGVGLQETVSGCGEEQDGDVCCGHVVWLTGILRENLPLVLYGEPIEIADVAGGCKIDEDRIGCHCLVGEDGECHPCEDDKHGKHVKVCTIHPTE